MGTSYHVLFKRSGHRLQSLEPPLHLEIHISGLISLWYENLMHAYFSAFCEYNFHHFLQAFNSNWKSAVLNMTNNTCICCMHMVKIFEYSNPIENLISKSLYYILLIFFTAFLHFVLILLNCTCF